MLNRKILPLLLAAAITLTGCSIGEPESHMDTYRYDGYLNAQWGSTPDEVATQLQLPKSQWVRMEDELLDGMPEGTFGYEVIRTTMLFGLYTETELYFAQSLNGIGEYLGFYGMKITFIEDPEYYSTSDLSYCDADFELNGDDAIKEFQARAHYNRNVTEGTYTDEQGEWKTISWYCVADLAGVENADAKAMAAELDEVLSMWGSHFDSIADDPLSAATIYYGNPNAESYILFSGLPAAILRDAE